jgi:hypothetical protein
VLWPNDDSSGSSGVPQGECWFRLLAQLGGRVIGVPPPMQGASGTSWVLELVRSTTRGSGPGPERRRRWR